MRPMTTVALIAVLSIGIHGTFSPAGADTASSTNCPRILSAQRVMGSEHVNEATTLVYKVILKNVGQGLLTDNPDSEAVLVLPPRAKVDPNSQALQGVLTVVSEGEYDTLILWDLELAAGNEAVSSVTVTVQDKPIQDGAHVMMGEDEEPNLFLYVHGECDGGTAP